MTVQLAQVNIPEVVEELHSIYPQYEHALIENDVETLIRMFWASPYVMRFGVSENLYGHEELEKFRQNRPSVNLLRKINRIDIVAFGRDTGSITLEFERQSSKGLTRGRQSQLWIRFAEGWRIVAAHVSILP